MSNLEHYFENLLFHGEDVYGGINKQSLTQDVQNAVEVCVQYVIYSLFGNRKAFEEFINEREDDMVGQTCEFWDGESNFCTLNRPSSQPTTDVAEVKHGKWVKENIVLTSNPPQYRWHCSACGQLRYWFNDSVLTNYCPNCGADMRERGED